MKKVLIAVLISSGLLADGVVNCIYYGSGITIYTDENGSSTMIVMS